MRKTIDKNPLGVENLGIPLRANAYLINFTKFTDTEKGKSLISAGSKF